MSNSFAHKIYSRILNDELWIVSDENCLNQVTDDSPVYLMKEVKLIKNVNLRTLQIIHAIKKKFGGEIVSETDNNSSNKRNRKEQPGNMTDENSNNNHKTEPEQMRLELS